MKNQVPGAGPLTSAILVAHLPEFGQRDDKTLILWIQATSYRERLSPNRALLGIKGGD